MDIAWIFGAFDQDHQVRAGVLVVGAFKVHTVHLLVIGGTG
jgi:hypothetical protein